MITTATGAPRDYAELYENYFDMITSIVWKAGINRADVEDVAMDLLTTFMVKDALSWYDPEKLFDVGDSPKLEGAQHRPAKFQGLLRRFCVLYVRQHLDKQAARERREPPHAKLDAPASSEDDSSATWGETHAVSLNFTTDHEHDLLTRHETRLSVTATLREARDKASVSNAAASLQESTHQARRQAQRDAHVALALEAAIDLGERGERVTVPEVASLARIPKGPASTALREARALLRASHAAQSA